jgi:transposase
MGMLSEEDDVEIHALARRGWSVSAIARHTGRDRKTVARYLAGKRPSRERAPSCLEPFRAYLEARLGDDAHVFATTLSEELVALGFDRSYPTLVRELRQLGFRPECECCRAGAVKLTVGLEHGPGEELQLDWLELTVLMATTAYVVAAQFDWRSGLSERVGRARGFYGALAASIGLGVAVTLTKASVIGMLVAASVIGGLGTPFSLVLLVRLARDPTVMGAQPISIP